MKNDKLTDIIVELRNNNKTFREISYILKEEYGIERSPQAIQKRYATFVNAPKIEYDTPIGHIECDILNLYALGYNKSEILRIINEYGEQKIKYDYITKTINIRTTYLTSIKNTIIEKIKIGINNHNTYESVYNRLYYIIGQKTIKMKIEKYNKYIRYIFSDNVNRFINSESKRMMEFTRNKEMTSNFINYYISVRGNSYE